MENSILTANGLSTIGSPNGLSSNPDIFIHFKFTFFYFKFDIELMHTIIHFTKKSISLFKNSIIFNTMGI